MNDKDNNSFFDIGIYGLSKKFMLINHLKKEVQQSHDQVTPSDNSGLLNRLWRVLETAEPPVRAWLIAQIEAALVEVPFRDTSLTRSLPSYKEPVSDRLLSPQEASRLLNIPLRWIYRHTKRLPHRKLGRYTRFPKRELLKWAERQQIRKP